MRRTAILWLIILALWCLVFPPFRVVRLQAARESQSQRAFNPAAFAAEFWTNQLIQSLGQAADAGTVLAALAQDAPTAARRFGRSLGLSSATCYFLQGTGAVVSVEARGIGIALRGSAPPADVLLETGLIFGNTVRDATGLIDVNRYPNSQDFNAISAELNRLVETRVIPSLMTTASLGRRLRFVGCAEIAPDSACPKPLKMVPVNVTADE